MSNHPSYVDDVPVKISEKYKPPPEISLPNKIVQHLQKCSKSDDSTSYDFCLEKTVLSKTLEWKNIQIKDKNERQERIRLREQERLKRIEAEQKHKLNQVSYPSTDDLNSDEELETIAHKVKSVVPEEPKVQQKFDSILVPTVIMRDSPITLPGNPSTIGIKKTHQKKHSSGKIDFSYFENSNSNPFDNMEMKTMNDLDILAEILKPTMISEQNLERDNSSESDSDKTVNNNTKKEPQQIQHHVQQQQQQNYGSFYNYPPGQYNYYQQQNYQFYPPSSQNHNQSQNQTYAPQFTYQPSHYQQNINNNTIISDNSVNSYGIPYYQQMAQPKLEQEQISSCKSKSVPDIVKELNDELNNCEKRRVRNNSQTVQSREHEDENSRQSKENVASSKKSNDLEKDFNKLSMSSQNLVKNISLMGFPLELVSRCAQKIGPDEKNIIEHLIPLSELLDLGFDESTISDALIKFNNNKDKALDYLIS